MLLERFNGRGRIHHEQAEAHKDRHADEEYDAWSHDAGGNARDQALGKRLLAGGP